MGETVPEVLRTALGRSTQTERTVSPNADRPRPVNNIFIFPTEIYKFQENFPSLFNQIALQPMCVEVGRTRVDA